MRYAAASVLAALVLVAAAPASRGHAQSAESLVEEGIAAREERDDMRALELFRRAYDLERAPATLAQIALAEQALGRFVRAEAHLVEALEDRRDRFVQRNRPLLEQALSEIRSEIGTLSIEGGEEGATLFVGGREVGHLPLSQPVRVSAGENEIVARLEGFTPFIATVTVTGGQDRTVEVEMAPLPPEEPETDPVPHAQTHRGAPIQELLIGFGGIAIALGGLGLIGGTIAMVIRENAAVERQTCDDSDPECRALFFRANDAETTGIALYVTGTVVLGTGIALLLVGLDWHEPDDEAVRCAPGLLSVACVGRF